MLRVGVWTGTLSSATEEYIKDDVEKFENELPPGYSIKQLGEAETRGESQASLYSSAVIYMILIVIGLVLALNSFRQAGIILSVAILSIGLSFLGPKMKVLWIKLQPIELFQLV